MIAGMSEQSTTALELLVSTAFDGVTVIKLGRGRPLPGARPLAELRHCDLSVVDLLGLGYRTWSAAVEAELHERVLGRLPAVLVAPSGDGGGGWLTAPDRRQAGGRRLLLQHPLKSVAMRRALQELLAGASETATTRPASPATVAQDRQEDHDAQTTDAGFPSTQPPDAADEEAIDRSATPAGPAQAGPQVPASSREGASGRPAGLSEAALAALVAACPEAARNPYVNLVCGIVVRRAPQEFQIGAHSGGVIVPTENWAASNISNAMRNRLLRHPTMLQIVKIRTVDESEAIERAARLFGRRADGRRPLDSFLWSLVYNSYADAPPLASGDLWFRLECFPNFTRLPATPGLFIQLALLSLRGPQSIARLTRTFAAHDPRQVTLFVLCAVLSGMATVLPAHEAAGAPMPAREAPRAGARKAGFFRSLLSKLF